MKPISQEDVKNLLKHDRISVTYLNRDNEEVTKNTRFHSIDGNNILVYVPKKQKSVWEIPLNSQCKISKI